MIVYQIHEIDFDHSFDKNDFLPTEIIFLKEEDAKKYAIENGCLYYPVEVKD